MSKLGKGSFLFVGDCPLIDLEKDSKSVEISSYINK